MATPLSTLGEFGLIDTLTANFPLRNLSSKLGIGDDCAILQFSDKQIVVTTDLLMEGIHFDLSYCPLKHLGYKAVAVNLSDVYAMMATPRQITVSIAVSSKFSVEALEQLYEGIRLACERFDVDLIGGDTSSSLTGMALSITAIGEVDSSRVVRRNGAQLNDLICVSGDLGAAYMGLQMLEREKHVFNEGKGAQPMFDGYSYIIERQLKPEPRRDVVRNLYAHEIFPTSMIDISDGLSSELHHICRQSGVGCKVYEDKIPVNEVTGKAAREFGIEPQVAALNGGEDYELLFTVPSAEYKKVAAIPDVFVIGHITEAAQGLQLISQSGNSISLRAQGWQGF